MLNPMINDLLAKEVILKSVGAGYGKYVIYDREWLYEHLDEEFKLLKETKEMKPTGFSKEDFEKWMKKIDELAIDDDE